MVDDIWANRRGSPRFATTRLRMMYTCAPRTGPAITAGPDAAVDLRLHRQRDRRALLQSDAAIGQRIDQSQEQDPACQHPPDGAAPELLPNTLRMSSRASTPSSPRATGPRPAPRRSATNCATKVSGSPGEDVRALMRGLARRPRRRLGWSCCKTRADPRAWNADGGLGFRSPSRTATAGTGAGLPAGWTGCAAPRVQPDSYLPQAVIAAAHATAATCAETDRVLICAAYDRLIALDGSPVARANRALAIGFRDGFEAGLSALDEVADDPRLARSNTVASIRADLLRRAGRPLEAAAWYRISLDHNGSAPTREFLLRRLAECMADG